MRGRWRFAPRAVGVVGLWLAIVLPPMARGQANPDLRAESARIQQFFNAREFPKAARRAEALVEKFPDDAAAWMVLASCHLAETWPTRQDARALEAARRARELAGDQPHILYALAVASFRQREPDTLALLDQLLDPQPSPYDPYQRCELLLMRAMLRVHGEDQSPEVRRLARADLDRCLEINPRQLGARQLRADLLREDGQYEEALQDLAVVFGEVPGNKQLQYSLYLCYRGLHDMEKASHHLKVWKLVQRLTDSIAATSAPELEERLGILRELSELNPTDVRRRIELVQVELMVGDLDRAEAEWKALKERHPEWDSLVPLKAEIDRRRAESDGGE